MCAASGGCKNNLLEAQHSETNFEATGTREFIDQQDHLGATQNPEKRPRMFDSAGPSLAEEHGHGYGL